MRFAIFIGAAWIADALLQTVGKSIEADHKWSYPTVGIAIILLLWDFVDFTLTHNRK